jgi:hypothetical protein
MATQRPQKVVQHLSAKRIRGWARMRAFATCDCGAVNIEWTVVVAIVVGISMAVTLAVSQQAHTVNQVTVSRLASTVDQ